MENSPDRNMAPPAEGRRSISINPMLGERSGTSTPKSLATPVIPVPQSSGSSSRSKAIAKSFGLYTQAVVNNATRTVHRDTVKARLERQSLEKDRWQKHYHGFATMAEEQSRQLRKSQVSSDRSEEAIRKLEEIQEKAIEGMASCMVAAGSNGKSPPLLEEDTRSRHLEKEVGALKDDICGIMKRLDNATQDVARINQDSTRTNQSINDRVSFQRNRLDEQIQAMRQDHVTKQTLTATESKIAETTVNMSKLQVKQDELNDQILKLREQLKALPSEKHDKLDDKVAKMEDQINSLNSLAFDVSKVKEDIFSISGNVTEQTEKFKELNDFVTGDENSGETSLTDIVKESDSKITKHADALQNLNDELGELNNLKEEFTCLAARITKMEARPSMQPSAPSDQPKLSNGLNTEIAVLKGEVARITREQQEKDDIVAEEFDRLGNLLSQKNEEVERLRKLWDNQETSIKDIKDQISNLNSQSVAAKEVERLSKLSEHHDVFIKNVNDQISNLRSQSFAAIPRKSITPSPQANGVRSPEEPVLRQKIEELETSLKQFKEFSREKMAATEVFVVSQEQRFNNLTTEHMAKSMIDQMQRLYPPHPGNVMGEIHQVKGRQQAIEELFRAFQGRLESISNFLAPAHQIQAQLHTMLNLQTDVKKIFEILAQTEQNRNSAIKEVKDLIQDHSIKIESFVTDIAAIKKQQLSAVETSRTELNAMRSDLRDIEATTIKECSNLTGEIAAISKAIEQTTRNPPPYDTDASSPPTSRKHRPETHLLAVDDSDSFSPSSLSRQRAGSIRSAASNAKIKLASVTSNGTATPTRKSRRKRERGSEGSESDWHPGRKISRLGGD